MSMPRAFILILLIGVWGLAPARAAAQVVSDEWLCDSSVQNCRNTLIALIDAEPEGIDVGFWFMEDSRYLPALIAAKDRGVRVRVLIDTKADASYPLNPQHYNALRDAGIPIRRPVSRYFHWKTMIFAGQNVVETGSANYSPSAFDPIEPLVNFQDESIYFTNDQAIVDSFKKRFDDYWVDTSAFRNYSPTTMTLTRAYPTTLTIHGDLNFPPHQDFAVRSVARYNAEPAAPAGAIDTIMYRITDARHTDAIIAAHQRGVPVRIITEPSQYRSTKRWQHSYNVDRMFAAGISIRHRGHEGENHQKLTLLRSQGMAIFGSHNWTHTAGQYEHNYFTRKAHLYDWFRNLFERKWNLGGTETEPFAPLASDTPVYNAPATGSRVTTSDVTLRWHAGFWAHKYDIYFGTSDNPPLLVADVELGNSTTSTDYVEYTITGLVPDVTYHWRIVSKTMANWPVLNRSGTTWNFRTGAPPVAGPGDVVLHAMRATTVQGWTPTSDQTAAGLSRLGTANNGVRVSAPLASPNSFFDMTFTADAGVPYRLWIRGKAISNSWANDSAFVQFSDSVTSTGSPTWQIGTTSATTVTIEDCTSCGLSNWGWNDNLTNSTAGALGTPVYFATSGEHRIRVQMREDGLSIDQIVLSRQVFMTTAPGTTKNDGTILPEQGGTVGGEEEEPPPPPPPLPTGWQSQDIGNVGAPGSANHSNGTYTVNGAGADVWGTADAFHYAFSTLTGDGTITARVASLTGSQDWTKVGVMIRGSTAPSSAQAFMLVAKANKGLAFQYRQSDGGTTLSVAGGTGTAPRWVRLTRAGSVITAFVSSDGVAWTTVGSGTFTMPATALFGLAVSSHTTSSTATGVFDSVSVSP